MSIFQQIIDFRRKNENKVKSILREIDELVLTARDERKICIYMTKYRVKSVNSMYLKTKRDFNSDINKIRDFAGYRIVCLFEQELFNVHKFILQEICNDETGFNLITFKHFNWEPGLLLNSIIELLDKHKSHPNIIPKEKDSKYKSIHYLLEYTLGGKTYIIEIQLRTLLQDVWGELEHALSYKQGNIHPHIRKSFILLARDIEKNDFLMSHLKSISDKEKISYRFSIEKAGPLNWCGYEEDLIPDSFKLEPIASCFQNYVQYMGNVKLRANKIEFLKKARELLGQISSYISVPMQKDKLIQYFITMEEAFIDFWEGNLEEALNRYHSIEPVYRQQYILQFRLGEVNFTKGEIEKALVHFDNCEYLLSQGQGPDIFNSYRIKLKMAFIYWLLGYEYIRYTINMVLSAERMFKENPDYFHNPEDQLHGNLLNNLCAYHLDQYIYDNTENNYCAALDRLNNLEDFLKSHRPNANMLDTLAWFYFNIYLKDGDPDKLDKAWEYAQLIDQRENISTFWITSLNIHLNHIQEIGAAIEKRG
jgi:ppGpp synthetase/RelA/SpoT-type nucleotidyltranferase